MFRISLAAVVAMLLLGFLPLEAHAAASRLALVIGNSNYIALPVLANPRVDAENVRRALESGGYRVSVLTDADRAGMLRALEEFKARVGALEPGSVALIYYAGHGFAVGGSNYLAPVDADMRRSDPVAGLIDMDSVLRALGSNDDISGIALFDACRQLPPTLNWQTYGFVRSERHNTFTAFSTELGALAADGGAGLGSPFANAIVRSLDQPGITPSQLLEMVRPIVNTATGGQTPIETNNLVSQVTVNDTPASPMARRVNLAFDAFARGLYRESLELATPAARAGDVRAMSLLGDIYFVGFEGNPRDEAAALRWFRRAREAGGARERFVWAIDAAASPAAEQRDRDEAITIIQAAAAGGDPEALYSLGYANLGREGIRFTRFIPDISAAPTAYLRAAEGGHIEAAINFGLMAYEGEGLPMPDPDAAARFFLQAAQAGSPRGMVKYANIESSYRTGHRNPERDAIALEWYRRAARWNEPEALLRLAVAYAFGVGVEPSHAQALAYLEQAERAATPLFRASNMGIPRQIDGFARALRSGQPLTEPACIRAGSDCALSVGF